MLHRVLLILMLGIGEPVGASGADSGASPPVDPLGPLVAEALHANLALNGERLGERRAAAEAFAARARFLPEVSAESRASRLDGVPDLGALLDPVYSTLNTLTASSAFPSHLALTLPAKYESHLRITQPLVNEAVRANAALAGARHDAQRDELAGAARTLAAAAQSAYLQEAADRRITEIFAATLELVRENERVAGRLLAAGTSTPEAVLRARADRTEVEQQLADAAQRAAAAARELNRILGRPLEQPVETIPDSAFDRPLDVDADAALTSALAHREELDAAGAGVRVAHAAKRIATASLLPSLSGAFDLGWQGPREALRRDDRSWSASVVASWDLFRASDLAHRSAAGYEEARARTAQRDAEERVRVEVRNALDAARVAHAAIATSNTRAAAARSTFALVRRRYEEGSASPVELVDARTTLTGAETNALLTLYRYALSRVDLERVAALRPMPRTRGDIR